MRSSHIFRALTPRSGDDDSYSFRGSGRGRRHSAAFACVISKDVRNIVDAFSKVSNIIPQIINISNINAKKKIFKKLFEKFYWYVDVKIILILISEGADKKRYANANIKHVSVIKIKMNIKEYWGL